MANDADTKVKVIKGSYTHQMRCNLKLDKNRDESYSHHAVDAMLIGYSELGYEAYHKLQGEFIDFETGEILERTCGMKTCRTRFMQIIYMEKMGKYQE